MRTVPFPLLVCVAVFLLLVPVSASAAGQPDTSQLKTGTPVAVSGYENLTATEGAVRFLDSSLPHSFALEADEVVLEFAWENGTIVADGGRESVIDRPTETGRRHSSFSNVTIGLSPFQGHPQVLAYPDNGSPKIHATGTGDHSFHRLQRPYLATVGKSPETQDAGDAEIVGFWYEPPDAWLVGRDSDHATVTGNFSLLVNNATVSVDQEGETVWENWTGYREGSPGVAVQQYERHLLLVHVTNGRLEISSENGIDVAGSLLRVEATGVVSAPGASGRVVVDGTGFLFEDEPIRIRGTGSVAFTEPPERERYGSRLRLGIGSGSDFEIEGGQRLEATTGPTLGPSGGILLWGGLLALTAVAVGGVAYRTGLAGSLLQGWKSRRYTKWMTRGRELAHARDHAAAIDCFARATSAEPAKGVAWYHLAINLLEAERPAKALDVVDQARGVEAILDELDFLELEVEAALRVGDAERCRAALERLAEGSEPMARSLAADLQLDERILGAEMARRLGRDGGREDLPGYV